MNSPLSGLYLRVIPSCGSWLRCRSRSHSTAFSASVIRAAPDGSDGVVTYASAHLDGAASELIVRGTHQVSSNPGAQAEVARILRLN